MTAGTFKTCCFALSIIALSVLISLCLVSNHFVTSGALFIVLVFYVGFVVDRL